MSNVLCNITKHKVMQLSNSPKCCVSDIFDNKHLHKTRKHKSNSNETH